MILSRWLWVGAMLTTCAVEKWICHSQKSTNRTYFPIFPSRESRCRCGKGHGLGPRRVRGFRKCLVDRFSGSAGLFFACVVLMMCSSCMRSSIDVSTCHKVLGFQSKNLAFALAVGTRLDNILVFSFCANASTLSKCFEEPRKQLRYQ